MGDCLQEQLEDIGHYGKKAIPLGVASAGLGGFIGAVRGHDNENSLSIAKGALVGVTAGFLLGESIGIIGLSLFEFKIPRVTLAFTMLGGSSLMIYSLIKSPDNSSVQLMKSTAMGMTAGLMVGLPIDYLDIGR